MSQMSQSSYEKLLRRVKKKRAELISLGIRKGLSSKWVMNASNELDQLIYAIQLYKRNHRFEETDYIDEFL